MHVRNRSMFAFVGLLAGISAFSASVLIGHPARADEKADKKTDKRIAKAPPDAAVLFKKLDANADGQVTQEEAGAEKERLFKRLLRSADKDSDGQLSVEEFSAGLTVGSDPAPSPSAGADALQKASPQGDVPKDAAKERPAAGAMFKRLDANGDGKVVADEFPAERRENFARLLKRADADGDGALSSEEFSKLGPPPGARPMTGPGRLIGALDANGDGQLSAEEISAASEALKKLDRDGDGKLNARELGRPPVAPLAAAALPPAAAAAKLARKQKSRGVDVLVARALEADADGDGKLSAAEAPKKLQKPFTKIDGNGDGQLDQGELKARFASAQKKKPANAGQKKKGDKQARAETKATATN